MWIAKVVGRISLVRLHPSIAGKRWVLAVPQGIGAIASETFEPGEEMVALDDLGAREGDLIGMSDGAEAAAPFVPELKPIGAYTSCILDTIDLDRDATAQVVAASKKSRRGAK